MSAALAMATTPEVIPVPEAGCYFVSSASVVGGWRKVDAATGTCSCPAGRRGTICRHLRACYEYAGRVAAASVVPAAGGTSAARAAEAPSPAADLPPASPSCAVCGKPFDHGCNSGACSLECEKRAAEREGLTPPTCCRGVGCRACGYTGTVEGYEHRRSFQGRMYGWNA